MARKIVVQQLYSPQLQQLQYLLRVAKLDPRISESEFDKVCAQVDELMLMLMQVQMRKLTKPAA